MGYEDTPEGKAYLLAKQDRDREAAGKRAVDRFNKNYPDLAKDNRWRDKVDRLTIGSGWETASDEERDRILDHAAQQVIGQKQDHTRRRTARDIIKSRQQIQRGGK